MEAHIYYIRKTAGSKVTGPWRLATSIINEAWCEEKLKIFFILYLVIIHLFKSTLWSVLFTQLKFQQYMLNNWIILVTQSSIEDFFISWNDGGQQLCTKNICQWLTSNLELLLEQSIIFPFLKSRLLLPQAIYLWFNEIKMGWK